MTIATAPSLCAAPGRPLDPGVRASLRAHLPPDALLAVDEIAALLPSGTTAETAAWLSRTTRPAGTCPTGEPLYRWSDVLAALGTQAGERAITTWSDAARALGVHSNTLARKRKERGDTSPAWWQDADALKAWWTALLTTPTSPAPHTRATGPSLAELKASKKAR